MGRFDEFKNSPLCVPDVQSLEDFYSLAFFKMRNPLIERSRKIDLAYVLVETIRNFSNDHHPELKMMIDTVRTDFSMLIQQKSEELTLDNYLLLFVLLDCLIPTSCPELTEVYSILRVVAFNNLANNHDHKVKQIKVNPFISFLLNAVIQPNFSDLKSFFSAVIQSDASFDDYLVDLWSCPVVKSSQQLEVWYQAGFIDLLIKYSHISNFNDPGRFNLDIVNDFFNNHGIILQILNEKDTSTFRKSFQIYKESLLGDGVDEISNEFFKFGQLLKVFDFYLTPESKDFKVSLIANSCLQLTPHIKVSEANASVYFEKVHLGVWSKGSYPGLIKIANLRMFLEAGYKENLEKKEGLVIDSRFVVGVLDNCMFHEHLIMNGHRCYKDNHDRGRKVHRRGYPRGVEKFTGERSIFGHIHHFAASPVHKHLIVLSVGYHSVAVYDMLLKKRIRFIKNVFGLLDLYCTSKGAFAIVQKESFNYSSNRDPFDRKYYDNDTSDYDEDDGAYSPDKSEEMEQISQKSSRNIDDLNKNVCSQNANGITHVKICFLKTMKKAEVRFENPLIKATAQGSRLILIQEAFLSVATLDFVRSKVKISQTLQLPTDMIIVNLNFVTEDLLVGSFHLRKVAGSDIEMEDIYFEFIKRFCIFDLKKKSVHVSCATFTQEVYFPELRSAALYDKNKDSLLLLRL